MSKRVLRHSGLALGIALSAVTALTSAQTATAADDGGLGQFFREQFGIGSGQSTGAEPYGYDLPDDRPLVVRPKRHVSRKPRATIATGPVAPVSIYEDKTLRPGDAVMTAKGVRIFLGGNSMPYSEADFVAIADSDGLPRDVQKALLVIDKAPRT